MGNPAWHVLHSKPHKENQLNAYLQAQGHEVFYPTLKVQPVNPRSSKIRPYFPGYMFIHVDIDEVGISALQWVPGANRLVAFDGCPATIPEHVIRELKSRIAKIEAAGGLALEGLKRGDVVEIINGPFAGYEAIFDMRLSGNERVQVLLDILGRQVRVKVLTGSIEKKRSK